jgi:hypothetical protein
LTFSDGLAVAAIALSFFTIFLGVLFYKWQGDLAREMHSLLGEIKTRTTRTEEELQAQFKLVLEAALGQQRVSIGEEVAPRVDALEGQLGELEVKLSATSDAALRTIVADLKRDVSSLKGELAGLREGAASAGEGLLTDRDAVLRITQEFLSSGRSTIPPLIGPATQARMKLLLQDLVAGSADDAAWLMYKYGETFKAAEKAGLIELYNKAGQVGPALRLTQAGRVFLGAAPPTKNGAAE